MSPSLGRLLICVLGVYSTFLLWAIAQERLSQPFPSILTHHGPHRTDRTPHHGLGPEHGTSSASGDKIPSATVINVFQSMASCLSAVGYLSIRRWWVAGRGRVIERGTKSDGWKVEEAGKGVWELIGWDALFGLDGRSTGDAPLRLGANGNGHSDKIIEDEALITNADDSNGVIASSSTALSGTRLIATGHLTPRTYITGGDNTGSIAPSRSTSPFLAPALASKASIPASSFTATARPTGWIQRNLLRPTPLSLLLRTSLLQSLTPLFAHASLSYISYPTLILGKSCKLLPVMAMNVLVYRRKFGWGKYAVVGMVSLGIGLFMACGKGGKAQGQGDSAWGMALLGMSLLIDGLTNSTQDELFRLHPNFTGQALMFNMSFFSLCMTLPIVLMPPGLPRAALRAVAEILPVPIEVLAPFGLAGDKSFALLTQGNHQSPLVHTLSFITTHPASLGPIIQFALLGGIGQLFIFETISSFGSLTLVMLTVTRKLVTMLLSVVIFGHELEMGQWAGVAVVFAGIALEAGLKRKEITDKKAARQKLGPRLKAD